MLLVVEEKYLKTILVVIIWSPWVLIRDSLAAKIIRKSLISFQD